MKNKIIMLLVLCLTVLSLAGCGTTKDTDPVQIQITLESGEVMKGELYPDIAPISVENFVNLVEENFFDGLIFHRVIPGFMIQGGGYDQTFYDGNFNSKEADEIKGEFSANGVTNELKHTRGVLSMARAQAMNSGSSQFFIMHDDAPYLDGQYAAFGKITEGLEVVDQIATAPTTELDGKVMVSGQEYDQTMSDVPVEPVVIKTIEIIDSEE